MRPPPALGFHGILNLDKPRGMTSHDVVARVRRWLGQRRVGHAGTLDPEATGVLLVLVGSATRLSEILMEGTKEYRAAIRFGATSTTDDAAGEIIPSSVAIDLDATAWRALFDRFLGEIRQVPPAYAAIKVGGRPLYESARRGQPVQVAPRTVRIDRLDLISWNGTDLTLDVTCSKGTYIRALARDLGVATGAGAYLASLVRARSGGFRLDDAVTLDDLADAATGGYVDHLLYPLDAALARWPALLLSSEQVTRVYRGQNILLPRGSEESEATRCDSANHISSLPIPPTPLEATFARGYDAARGRLIALLRAEGPNSWHPEKVFPEDARDDAS